MSAGVTPFTAEQPARLNHLVDSTIPLTWQVRWRTFKFISPLLILSSVCLAEIIFVQRWLADEMASAWPAVILVMLIPPLIMLIAFEVEVRLRHRRKRQIVLKKHGLILQPSGKWFPWRHFVGFRFEPITGQPELTRCIVLKLGPRKQEIEVRPRALVLDAMQRRALIQAVPRYRPASLGEYRIEESHTAAPLVRQGRVPFMAMTVHALGLYLFLHGGTQMGVFLDDPKPREPIGGSDIVISERRGEQIARFVKHHFHTVEEFRAFGFWTGTALLVAGIGAIGVGSSMLRRSRMA